jgi:hypothetical protein
MGVFIVFLFIIVIISIVAYVNSSSSSNNSNNYQQRSSYSNNTQSNRPLADKNHYIIRRFMTQVDAVIGEEYLHYEVIHKLRQETLYQLIDAYNTSPDEITAFSNQIDHRLWALKQMCKLTLEELGTGKYHLRNVVKPEGNILIKVNKNCLNLAYQYGYIDTDELNQAIKELNDVIRETGEWA